MDHNNRGNYNEDQQRGHHHHHQSSNYHSHSRGNWEFQSRNDGHDRHGHGRHHNRRDYDDYHQRGHSRYYSHHGRDQHNDQHSNGRGLHESDRHRSFEREEHDNKKRASSQTGSDEDASLKRIRSEQTTDSSKETSTEAAAPIEKSNGVAKSANDDVGAVSFAIPGDEEAQKKTFIECMRKDDQDVTYVSNQAYQVPENWNTRKQAAAEKTLELLTNVLHAGDESDEYEDDSSYDSNAPGAYPSSKGKAGLTDVQRKFVLALPHCPPLDAGFRVVSSWAGASRICYCPCGPNVAPWREKHNINLGSGGKCFLKDEFSQRKKKSGKNKFDPNSLMAHLIREGGMFEEKESRKMVKRPLWDIYHYATRVYLECLYGNWHGRKNGKDFGHKGLYPKQSDDYEDAACEESRFLHKQIDIGKKEIQKRDEENKKLKVELEKKEKDRVFFKELSRDHQKRIEHLEKLEEKLQVQKKKKEELSGDQIAKYKEKLSDHFATMKQLVGGSKDFEIAVLSESGGSGFKLQQLFDTLYEKKSGVARTVFFSDENDSNKVTKLILSEWNIIYDKQEVYAFKNTVKHKKDARAKKKEDTGVDEGGPSRQFLTDVFRQLDTLFIKVGDGAVKLFENTPGGVQVVTDEFLNHRVEALVKNSTDTSDDTVEDSIKRAEDYVRAIGRIMLHAMVHEQTLPSNALPPFFMNVMFHGYGDDYHRHDILKHINMLGINAESTLKWLVEDDSGDLDENGNEWTPDTFFEKYIPDNFIHSSKILLGSLQEGLTIGNKPELSNDLEKGCGLSSVLSMIPLDAIQCIYFAKPDIKIEDLLGVLNPKFGEGEPDPESGMKDKDMKRLAREQKKFYDGNFEKYLRESADEDKQFLVKFVECATGSNYLPFDKNFKINIEFNFSVEPTGLPLFHACSFDIVIPGFESFFCNYKSFKDDKMNFAIREVFNQFQMN